MLWLLLSVAVTVNGNAYTVPDHPRLWLDGPAGTITTALKDPDGAGALKAPKAVDTNPAYVAMKAKIRTCVASNPPCAFYDKGLGIVHAALDWYMDNSQTNSLTAAKYWINNIESLYSQFQFGCDTLQQNCGIGSMSDWPSIEMYYYALAYTLVRSELSAGERTAFGQKMLNDITTYQTDAGCTNQLQPIAGAVVNYTTGTSVITGSGFSTVTAGRLLYVRYAPTTQYLWRTSVSVDSDSQITLSGPLQSWGGTNGGSVTGGTLYELQPWSTSTCGYAWVMKSVLDNPREYFGHYKATTLASDISTVATSVTVTNGAALAALTPPYYMNMRAEIMKVTNRVNNVLTVERAQLGTVGTAGYGTDTISYNKYIPWGCKSLSPYMMNLDLTKTIGHLAIGIVLLEDHANAAALVDEAASSLAVVTIPAIKEVWTGMQQSGSSNYGPGRVMSYTTLMAAALKQFTGAPSLDLTGGRWIKDLSLYTVYASVPGSPALNIPWGQPGIASTADYRTNQWAMLLPYLYPNSDEAKYFNYWQRTASNQYNSTFLSASVNDRIVPFALLWQDETDPSATYTGISTDHAFNVPDTSTGKAMNAWFSRTGWSSSSDTLVFQWSPSIYYTIDHAGTGAPGAYKLYKSGWTLGENGSDDTGQGIDTNMLIFGGAANLRSVYAGHSVLMDKSDSGTGWAFARTNALNAYTATATATRALRYLVHFKKAASPDYLVVYDDMASSAAKTLGQNLHYDKTTSQASSITDTLPDIVWTGPNRRVSTKVVLPAGTGVARTSTSLTSSFRENICASSDGTACAAATSVEFLLVHRPSTSTSDTMPTVAALGTIDANYSGVQIEGTAPSVAVFPKAGLYHASTSFTSTHADTGQYVVTGLEAGIYDVVRGATTIVDDETIDSNGTIAFESVAGAFTITRAGAVPAITITTTTLSNATQYESYSAQLAYTGGTPPVTWTVSAGTICTGLSLSTSGAISGTATVGQTCNFTAKVVDAAAAEDTQALAITVQTPPPSLTVTATPGSTSVTITFGTPTLAENQSCSIVVSSLAIDPGTGLIVGPVANTTSAGGPATRSVSLSGLVSSTSHTAQVTCGTVASGSTSFATLAESTPGGGGTVNWTYTVKPHARLVARGVTKVTVSYTLENQDPPEAAATETAACATGCTVTLPLLSGEIYSIFHVWKTAGDATVATSRPALVAVP